MGGGWDRAYMVYMARVREQKLCPAFGLILSTLLMSSSFIFSCTYPLSIVSCGGFLGKGSSGNE